MGYLDALPEGLQSVYGGTQQLYRKPQYTQIGQTRVTSPTRLPLGGSMYGGQALEMPTVGAGGPSPLAPPPDQGIPETGLQTGAEDYLGETGQWEQLYLSGDWRWMPTNAQEGQVYDDQADTRWMMRNGEWIKFEYLQNVQENPRTLEEWFRADSVLAETGKGGNYFPAEGWNTIEEWMQWRLDGRVNDENRAVLENGLRLKGIDPTTGTELEADFTNWQDQITDFMGTLESGDITYDPDTGTFVDAEGNTQTGWVADWMKEVVGQSYETGGISGELFTIDEDGNIVLAEELQTMSDWFENNPDVQQDYMEYNRQLAAHAIASGKSLNSGYYSEAAADAVSNYAAQQTDQIAQVMMEDIGSQFEYIANSIANMMKDIWKGNQQQMFQEAMATQRAALEQQYDQWTQQMAANVAETNAARQGEIITSIFTFIINMGLLFL